jgi:TIR domain
LRDVVLDLLNTYPHRSYAIVNYVKFFYDDIEVIKTLWAVVNNESRHGQVRANCLRALYKLLDADKRIETIVEKWLHESDLSLSMCAIEMMQQFPHSIKELEKWLNGYEEGALDRHLLYSIISTKFVLLDSDDDKEALILWCFDREDYMLKSLGVYFLSTNVHLLDTFSEYNSELVQNLIRGVKNSVSVHEVVLNIRNLFGIERDFALSSEVLSTLSNLNQYIINMMFSRETNRDEYLRNLSEFLTRFSRLYQRVIRKDFFSLFKTYESNIAFEYSKMALAKLSDARSSMTFLGTTPALAYIDSEKVHDGIAEIIYNALLEFQLTTQNLPEAAIQDAIASTESSLPIIFFSYSHDDEVERKELEMSLKYLKTYGFASLWSDRKIPPGQVWNPELTHVLNDSTIVLFLITSNFLGSEFIYKEEMPRAILNYNAQKTVCIPVLLKACDWQLYPYEHLQAIPEGALPISQWATNDSAYTDISQKIRKVIAALKDGSYTWRKVPSR